MFWRWLRIYLLCYLDSLHNTLGFWIMSCKERLALFQSSTFLCTFKFFIEKGRWLLLIPFPLFFDFKSRFLLQMLSIFNLQIDNLVIFFKCLWIHLINICSIVLVFNVNLRYTFIDYLCTAFVCGTLSWLSLKLVDRWFWSSFRKFDLHHM